MESTDSDDSDDVAEFTQAFMSGVKAKNVPSKQRLDMVKRQAEKKTDHKHNQDKKSKKNDAGKHKIKAGLGTPSVSHEQSSPSEDSDDHTDGDSDSATDDSDEEAAHSRLSSSDTSENGGWEILAISAVIMNLLHLYHIYIRCIYMLIKVFFLSLCLLKIWTRMSGDQTYNPGSTTAQDFAMVGF